MNITLIAAALAAALSFGSAWKIQAWRYDAAEASRLATEAKAKALAAELADGAAASHEADKAAEHVEFQTIYRDVNRVVTKTVYRDRVCLDPDGLRVLHEAITGHAAPAGEPASGVPGPVGPG